MIMIIKKMFTGRILLFFETMNQFVRMLTHLPAIGEIINRQVVEKNNYKLSIVFGVIAQIGRILYEFIGKVLYVFVFMYIPYKFIAQFYPYVKLSVQITHSRIFFGIFLYRRLGFGLLNGTFQIVHHRCLTFLAEPACLDRGIAVFTVDADGGIICKYQSFFPDPLMDLRCLHFTGFGNFRDPGPFILSDVILYFLKLFFYPFPACRTDRHTHYIIENPSTFSAIAYFHNQHLQIFILCQWPERQNTHFLFRLPAASPSWHPQYFLSYICHL